MTAREEKEGSGAPAAATSSPPTQLFSHFSLLSPAPLHLLQTWAGRESRTMGNHLTNPCPGTRWGDGAPRTDSPQQHPPQTTPHSSRWRDGQGLSGAERSKQVAGDPSQLSLLGAPALLPLGSRASLAAGSGHPRAPLCPCLWKGRLYLGSPEAAMGRMPERW